MNRTVLFFAVLAALLCVGVSEKDLRARVGLSSNSNNDKDNNKNFLSNTGQDGATVRGKVDEDGHDNQNGNGHDQHGNGNGKGHGYKVDCVVGEWQSWASCSKSCGGGTRPRTRPILTPASGGGAPCPETSQNQPCNTQYCPDCVVGPWSDWGSCTKTCGGGNQTRTRPIVTPGGAPCPETKQTRVCNTQYCPEPCVVGPWSNWGSCSKSCGGGNQTRTRSIITPASGGGTPCPETQQIVPCNTQYCPEPCVVGPWSDWGMCTKTCGGGNQTRTRSIITPPRNGGTPCPETQQITPCNTQYCPEPCVVGYWSDWTTCSKSCDGGNRTRTRPIITPPRDGGAPCPETKQTEKCNTQYCPVDCAVGHWSDWTVCSKPCGGGSRTRTRSIVTPPRDGGAPCPETKQTEQCNTQYCVDCGMSEWQTWGTCTKSCGGGVQSRTRRIITPPVGGAPCPETADSVPCNTQSCPYN